MVQTQKKIRRSTRKRQTVRQTGRLTDKANRAEDRAEERGRGRRRGGGGGGGGGGEANLCRLTGILLTSLLLGWGRGQLLPRSRPPVGQARAHKDSEGFWGTGARSAARSPLFFDTHVTSLSTASSILEHSLRVTSVHSWCKFDWSNLE